MARPGIRLPIVTLYAEKVEVETAFRKATKPWICYTCQKPYTLLESMGQLECFQHPGFMQENGIWSCCGKKMHPVRWTKTSDVQRLYEGKRCYNRQGLRRHTPTNVRGCQPCDHNTSNTAWNHADATEIAHLSALLPVMNKEFPFVSRKGFEHGLLRRCATRLLHCPPCLDAEVTYMQNDGSEGTHIVHYYYKDANTIVYRDAGEIRTVNVHSVTFKRNESRKIQFKPLPEGMEKKAVTEEGAVILNWWVVE